MHWLCAVLGFVLASCAGSPSPTSHETSNPTPAAGTNTEPANDSIQSPIATQPGIPFPGQGEGFWCYLNPGSSLQICSRRKEGCTTSVTKAQAKYPKGQNIECKPRAQASCFFWSEPLHARTLWFCYADQLHCEKAKVLVRQLAVDKDPDTERVFTECAEFAKYQGPRDLDRLFYRHGDHVVIGQAAS